MKLFDKIVNFVERRADKHTNSCRELAWFRSEEIFRTSENGKSINLKIDRINKLLDVMDENDPKREELLLECVQLVDARNEIINKDAERILPQIIQEENIKRRIYFAYTGIITLVTFATVNMIDVIREDK